MLSPTLFFSIKCFPFSFSSYQLRSRQHWNLTFQQRILWYTFFVPTQSSFSPPTRRKVANAKELQTLAQLLTRPAKFKRLCRVSCLVDMPSRYSIRYLFDGRLPLLCKGSPTHTFSLSELASSIVARDQVETQPCFTVSTFEST